jgi:hypothetical protein
MAARAGAVLRRARRAAWTWRQVLVSAVMVAAGCGLALLGGWFISRWCMGLVLIVEAGALVFLGLSRDDGANPVGRGARTVDQVLDDERLRP